MENKIKLSSEDNYILRELFGDDDVPSDNIPWNIIENEKIKRKLKEFYEITLNPEHKVLVSEFNNYIKLNIPYIKKNKIKLNANMMGIKSKTITENKKTARYYIGLKIIH